MSTPSTEKYGITFDKTGLEPICSVDNCIKRHHAEGYCWKHYQEHRLDPTRPCPICGKVRWYKRRTSTGGLVLICQACWVKHRKAANRA